MKRLSHAVTVVGVALAACVPASEAPPPRGAFGFVTEPSPATLGEAFLTSDGWTIRIDKLVLQVSVIAHSTTEKGRDSYGSYESYRFDARQVVEVFARKVPVGPASASMSLTGGYLAYDSTQREDERTEVLGVQPEDNARFLLPSDADVLGGDDRSRSGPSALLAIRAVQAGRVITLDLTLNLSAESEQGLRVVQQDALVTAPVRVVGEALFADVRTQLLKFDDVAAADADEDGAVTSAELSAATFTELRARARRIFVAR